MWTLTGTTSLRCCVEISGGQTLLSVLSGSHEEFYQHGPLRQQEDQTQAEEVPDPPAHAAGRQRQGLHQRYHQRILLVSILWHRLTSSHACGPQIRCSAAASPTCVKGRTPRCPRLSRCASTTWRMAVGACDNVQAPDPAAGFCSS